ncbi:MAG TPA: ROK family protein [Pseudomonadales bacterium]|nr:ROK family protein [Pseudomonadales bacterium]
MSAPVLRHAGIDLGGTKTEIAVVDAQGIEHCRFRRPTPRDDYAGTLRLIRDLIGEAEARCGPVDSVGIGTPGAVIPATGLMKNCNSTWLNGRPLPADLEQACGRAVRLANDADCFALSEATDGAGAGVRTLFGVIAGTGVGGGIVVDGRLLRGPNAIAGEWGHNPMPSLDGAPEAVRQCGKDLASRACYCGRADCVETWVSGPALVRSWRELGGRAGEDADVEALLRAQEADPAARTALELHAWQFAAALATVINVLDPDRIVLGGGLSNLARLYTEVPARWDAFVFGGRVRTPLLAPRHGDSGGVRGAAWLGAASIT